MANEFNISSSMGDYLEVIYKNSAGGGVSVTTLSNALGVAKSSVHQAIHRLRDAGLVEQEPYGTISLTRRGFESARFTFQCHQVIKSFLVDVLGVSEKLAETEACGIEHAVSRSTFDKLRLHLDTCQKKQR